MQSRLKRGLKNFGLSFLATVMLTTGCAATYRQPNSSLRGRGTYVENLRRVDGYRTGFDIIPVETGFYEGDFFVSGYLRNGDVIFANEDVDNSNDGLLRNVRNDIYKIIKLNESSPDSHPDRTVYVTGIYDRDFEKDDRLDLETINVSGELYFTDPVGSCDFVRGFEFWNQDWWRWFNNVHYSRGFNPWWDVGRRGVFFERHGVVSPNEDWDGDGISNWSESVLGTNMYNFDSDYDGLDDLTELLIGTNPLDSDTDNDGYSDYYDPFPLWHSRYHEGLRHIDSQIWWGSNYNGVQIRHKPLGKKETPEVRFKKSGNSRHENIRYHRVLDNQEREVRVKAERERVKQKEPSEKIKKLRTKKTR